MDRLEHFANINRARLILAHTQIASALLSGIATGAQLRIDLGSSLSAAEISHIDAFWQVQLTNAIAELETARRLVEGGKR